MSSSQRSNFQSILEFAAKDYYKLTGQDLASHPLASRIQNCDSPDSVLAILQEQVRGVEEYENVYPKLGSLLQSVVNGLHAISTVGGVSSVSVSLSKCFIYLSVNSNAYLLG